MLRMLHEEGHCFNPLLASFRGKLFVLSKVALMLVCWKISAAGGGSCVASRAWAGDDGAAQHRISRTLIFVRAKPVGQ